MEIKSIPETIVPIMPNHLYREYYTNKQNGIYYYEPRYSTETKYKYLNGEIVEEETNQVINSYNVYFKAENGTNRLVGICESWWVEDGKMVEWITSHECIGDMYMLFVNGTGAKDFVPRYEEREI